MKLQFIALLMTCIFGALECLDPHELCYPEYPILDGLLCYKACEDGYSHVGGGPLCWGTCPSQTTNIGLVCTKKTYGRGVGKALSTCTGDNEKDGLLCYPKCKSGYYGVGPLCWAYCDAEYADHGALCHKNAHIYGRDVSDCPWYDVCGLCGGPWYNVCGKRRDCGGECKPGYHDDGCTCRMDVHIYAKHTYGRGVGVSMSCKPDEELNGALCYPPCEEGYYGVGPVCWAECSGETIDTGTQCQKKAYGRGVGKVVNCLKPVSSADITDFDGMVDLFKSVDGFKGIQAIGCMVLYTLLKPWILIIQTFNSCFSEGDWQTISLSFSAGAAAGVEISGEIGVAGNTKTREGLCFVGYCMGIKTDISIGAEVILTWWRDIGDVTGESFAYEVGVDIPATEIGVSATFLTSTQGDYIGTQFSIGVGVGVSPIDLGFNTCNTPKDETISIEI